MTTHRHQTHCLPLRFALAGLALLGLSSLGACGTRGVVISHEVPAAAGPTAEIEQAVNAPDRTDADRALDPGRRPVALLSFAGVRAGERVADLGAGGGYTTELLARVVGLKGAVFAQNSPKMLALIGSKMIEERLAQPANQRVVRVDREFDEPLPPEADKLDLVIMNVIYHDTVWLGADRARMNQSIFRALKPGGRYVIADSSAKDGSGTTEAKTLHRIDRAVVRDEVTRAGFVLEAESQLYRNPDDTRDWNSSPRAAGDRRGTSDRFLLRFVKRK